MLGATGAVRDGTGFDSFLFGSMTPEVGDFLPEEVSGPLCVVSDVKPLLL